MKRNASVRKVSTCVPTSAADDVIRPAAASVSPIAMETLPRFSVISRVEVGALDHAAGDLTGGQALLPDRVGDGGRDFAHPVNGGSDVVHGLDRQSGFLLYAGDLSGDFRRGPAV